MKLALRLILSVIFWGLLYYKKLALASLCLYIVRRAGQILQLFPAQTPHYYNDINITHTNTLVVRSLGRKKLQNLTAKNGDGIKFFLKPL